jgi:hypothetical protein
VRLADDGGFTSRQFTGRVESHRMEAKVRRCRSASSFRGAMRGARVAAGQLQVQRRQTCVMERGRPDCQVAASHHGRRQAQYPDCAFEAGRTGRRGRHVT